MKWLLTFCIGFIIIGCAGTNKTIYKDGDFTVEIRYYNSLTDSCECIKKPNYICDCIDTISTRKK